MKLSLKVTLIAGGYVAALLVASAAVAIRMASKPGWGAQAAGGMFAFGDSIFFVAVFGVLAVIPTGGALYLFRPYARFWTVLSRLCLAVAVTGPASAILLTAGRHATSSPLVAWVGLSLLRILVAPLLALTFLVCTLVTPHRSPRFVFLAATAMEALVTAYAGALWFVLVFLHRQ